MSGAFPFHSLFFTRFISLRSENISYIKLYILDSLRIDTMNVGNLFLSKKYSVNFIFIRSRNNNVVFEVN